MRALSTGRRPSLSNSARVGVEVEGAGDEHIEARIARLARRRDQIGGATRAELGADEDARPAARPFSPSMKRPLGADEIAAASGVQRRRR